MAGCRVDTFGTKATHAVVVARLAQITDDALIVRRPVGLVVMSFVEDRVHIDDVAVRTAHQGEVILVELMPRLGRFARRAGPLLQQARGDGPVLLHQMVDRVRPLLEELLITTLWPQLRHVDRHVLRDAPVTNRELRTATSSIHLGNCQSPVAW